LLGGTARGYFKSEIDLVGVESGHSAIEVKDSISPEGSRQLLPRVKCLVLR